MRRKRYVDVNRRTYGELSSAYLKHNDSIEIASDEEWLALLTKCINENVRNFDGKHASSLEFGPGSGRLLEMLEGLSKFTTAIELSPEMAHLSGQQAPDANIIIDDINNVDFKPGAFDIIVSSATIHTMPTKNAKKLIAKLYNWLDDDGFLIVATTLQHEHKEGFYEKTDYPGTLPRYRTFYTHNTLSMMLFEEGQFDSISRVTGNTDQDGKLWRIYRMRKEKYARRYNIDRSLCEEYWAEEEGPEFAKSIVHAIQKDNPESEVLRKRTHDAKLNNAMMKRRLGRTLDDIQRIPADKIIERIE